jgi:hypothetical protein
VIELLVEENLDDLVKAIRVIKGMPSMPKGQSKCELPQGDTSEVAVNERRSGRLSHGFTEDAISRILTRMWNCRGKHTTSIDKVKMEQIIREELHSVTQKSIECEDAVSREAAIKKLRADTLFVCTGDKMQAISDIEGLPPVTQKSKTGHWIPTKDISKWGYKCSECEEMQKCKDIVKKYTPKAIEQEHLRELTEEEVKAYSKALDKMYKPTGFNVFNDSCEDAVSRQAALNSLIDNTHLDGYDLAEALDAIENKEKLPPVTPNRKYGKWIIIDDCEQFIAKCSECGRIEDSRMVSKYPYCHCGCRMCGCRIVKPQESEDTNEDAE